MLKSSRLLEIILPQLFTNINIDCSATCCQNFGKYYVPYFWAKCLEIAEDQYLRSKGWRIGHYSCNVQSAVLWPSFFWIFSEIDPSKPNVPNIPFGIPALALGNGIGWNIFSSSYLAFQFLWPMIIFSSHRSPLPASISSISWDSLLLLLENNIITQNKYFNLSHLGSTFGVSFRRRLLLLLKMVTAVSSYSFWYLWSQQNVL